MVVCGRFYVTLDFVHVYMLNLQHSKHIMLMCPSFVLIDLLNPCMHEIS